jgi:hypothetical protein
MVVHAGGGVSPGRTDLGARLPVPPRNALATIGPIDQKWTIDDVVAEGDRVVVRETCSCEQESFFGVPARGTRQVFTAGVAPDARLRFVLTSRPEGVEHVVEFVERAVRGQRQDG